MTTLAIGIVMPQCVIREGGIHQVVLLIIHIGIVNTRHRVDDVESAPESDLIVFKHGPVQRPFHQEPDVTPALADNGSHVLLADRPENKPERHEKEYRENRDDINHSSIDAGMKLQEFLPEDPFCPVQ
jgi:hypothetical protein